MQSITETYEKRIKGLTEALTACLNDTDIAEELRKDAEYKVLATKLVNEKETSRLQEEMKYAFYVSFIYLYIYKAYGWGAYNRNAKSG